VGNGRSTTVSRRWDLLRPVIAEALADLVPAPHVFVRAGTALVDGTVCPTWDWNHRDDLYSVKAGYAGMNVQIACVLILPFLGVFIYLLARGDRMSAREVERDQELQRTIRSSTAHPSTAELDELAKLVDLKSHGDISEADYARAKDRILH